MEEKQAAADPASGGPPAAALEPAWRISVRDARHALWAALGALAMTILMGVLAGKTGKMPWAGYLWFTAMLSLVAAVVLCALAGIRALAALVRMGLAKEPVGATPPLQAIGIAVMAGFGLFLAFLGTLGLSRGRQLRKRGKVLLPPLSPAGAWAGLGLQSEVPSDVRAAVAARWRENGRNEHASVAAFARLTMDLMALGAPPELVYCANRDEREEIRHAELCFSLAKALDGQEGGPGPFPEAQTARTLPSNRTLALAKLAVDSLIDGALHEGVSARIIAELARRCQEPAIRSLLLELSADESRHSAHGWDVVEWCLAEGGAPVAHALRGAAAALPEHPASELPPAAQDGRWEAFGIHGAALEEEQHRLALANLSARVKTLAAAERARVK